MSTSFFTNFECENSLKWPQLVDTLEGAMMRFSTGGVIQPVRAMLPVKDYNGWIGLMPCYSGFDNIMCCKLISLYSDNKKYNAPTIVVYVLLFDTESGKLISIMEGENITKRRTAATSAVSARHLAVKTPPKKLAVLGSGLQALSHIQVLLNMYPSIEEISIWNYRIATATKLAEQVSGWQSDKTLKVCSEVSDCVFEADLIVTATFAAKPVLKAEWVKAGAHIMAVGAAVPDMAEMEPELLRKAEVFVDSYAGASKESGDILMSGCDIKAELGEVIGNQKGGRSSDEAITIYKSLGLAVQDLVSAKMIFDGSTGSGQSELPVPVFSNGDVEKYSHDLQNLGGDVTSAESVSSGFTTKQVKMDCTASIHGPKYITCSIKTGPADNSDQFTLCLVYRALTGQLLGLIQGDAADKLCENGKQTLFERMFRL